MGDLTTLLPAGGVFIAFVAVIGYLINGNRQDRADYRQAIKDGDGEVEAERERNRDLQQRLDAERAERRKAEDVAAKATAAVDRATEEILALKQRVGHLEDQLRRVAGEQR